MKELLLTWSSYCFLVSEAVASHPKFDEWFWLPKLDALLEQISRSLKRLAQFRPLHVSGDTIMEAQDLKTIPDLNLETPGALKQTGWQQYTRQPKVIAGAAVGSLLLLGLGISLFSAAPETEIYEAAPEVQLDKAAIVAGAQWSHEQTLFQSTEQLQAFRQQLLSQEAQRYFLVAQQQVTDPNQPCYGQSVFCALDQFQQDAIAHIEQARTTRDWQAILRALDRVAAVELARQSTLPTEPEVNLSQLAIDNLVQSHQRYRGAAAEAKAWEVQQDD